jgi:hypothetical protein
MRNILFALALLSVLLVACSTGEGSEKQTSQEAVASSGCLLSYKENLDALLPLERASAVAGKPGGEAKQKYSRVMKNPTYHSVQYTWTSERTKTVNALGGSITVPANDIVTLHGLKEVKLDDFQKSHRPPTQEQLDASRQQIDKAIEGKSDNEKVNENLKKLDELKVSKETQKSTAGTLNSVFAEVAKSYSNVAGIGEAAAWNSFENRLYIYEGGVEFSLTVEVSADGEVNKNKAMALGKMLVKCP